MLEQQGDLPNLDYAYLARFAQVQEGLITAVGASFTAVNTDTLPTSFQMHVAGRVRIAAGVDEVPMHLEFTGPDAATPTISAGFLLDPSGAFVYENRVGMLFAISMPVAIVQLGLHEVAISLGGQVVRRLKFEVTMDPVGQ